MRFQCPPAYSIGGLLRLILLTILLATAGCAEENKDLGISGVYVDEFGTRHTITNVNWKQESPFGDSLFHILSYYNETGIVIAQNDAANSFDPSLYSRFDWVVTTRDGKIYYCQTVYNGASVGDAFAGIADRTDPANGGCNAQNNFPWTKLTP